MSKGEDDFCRIKPWGGNCNLSFTGVGCVKGQVQNTLDLGLEGRRLTVI